MATALALQERDVVDVQLMDGLRNRHRDVVEDVEVLPSG
jgi:hypothetical protein